MKKLLFIVYLFVIASTLFSLIVLFIYDFRLSDLILLTNKLDIMKYQRLNSILLSPLKRLIISLSIFDLFTSGMFVVLSFDLLKKFFKLSPNKIAVQSKSTNGYGEFLIELMLSVFIKFSALMGFNFFIYQSNLQIEKILDLYSDELNQTQKEHLEGLRIYVDLLIVSGIVMSVLYVFTYVLKFLIVRKMNKRSISVAKPENLIKFDSYRVIQSSEMPDK